MTDEPGSKHPVERTDLPGGDVFHKTLLDNLPQKIFLKDKNSVYIACNEKFANDLGITPEAIAGKTDFDFFPAELAASYREDDKKVIREGETLDLEEKYREGGENVSVHTVKVPVKDTAGDITGILGIFWDITSRKKTETELRETKNTLESKVEKRTALLKRTIKGLKESESKFRALFENIADIIIIHDFDGKILEANSAACGMLGHGREKLLSKNIQDIEIPEFSERFSERIKQIQKEGAVSRQSACIKPDGRSVPVEVRAKIFNYGGAKTVLSVYTDITERLESERALEESAEKLSRSLDRSVEALASASEKRDPYTSGHHSRVCQLATAIAEEMGFSAPALRSLAISAKIHDIGKLYVPAEILDKPHKVSPAEFAIIMAHPSVGYDIVKKMDFPGTVARTILQHHERLNGSGYPMHLPGKDISLEAKILAVADVVEAMTAHRPYRAAYPIDKALDEILRNENVLFDHEIVAVCLDLFNNRKFSFSQPE